MSSIAIISDNPPAPTLKLVSDMQVNAGFFYNDTLHWKFSPAQAIRFDNGQHIAVGDFATPVVELELAMHYKNAPA